MRSKSRNYSQESDTEENINYDGKYDISGQSNWSRNVTLPFDKNEILVERHYHAHDGEVRYNPSASERSFTGVGPKGYVPSNERIKEEVSDALYLSSKIDATDIEVEVEDGIVYLNGTVESRMMKRYAEDLIYGLPWVIDVQNLLRVVRKDTGPWCKTEPA